MRALARVAIALALAGCTEHAKPPVIDDADAEARATYPDLTALYAGEHGLYRGCGPNGGVCHNGNEFPTLDSIGAIVDQIGVACNQKRKDPSEINDLCEEPGDLVEVAGEKIEIATLTPYQGQPLVGWNLVLREPAPAAFPMPGELLQVYRVVPDGQGGAVEEPFAPLGVGAAAFALDPADASRRTILLAMHADPGTATFVSTLLAESGVGRPDRFRFGDPNGNGVFGAELGGRLIKPGDPERSYLLRRLTDPSFGPLMPRANCCSWTRTSLRALWCWIDGLTADGSNATAPIDYDGCRPSPPVELLYPEPGPECEAQGLCPVQVGGGTGEPTFPSIYAEILTTSCAGAGCHDQGEPPGDVDFRSELAAYESLLGKVVPGDPAASPLWQRLSPELCGEGCFTMPLGRPPLDPAALDRIRTWIENGALAD